jgi:archaeal flagellin FlaB
MKFRNKGETGIGTLIVFIAMILVAAIASGVLLGTAGSLQQKALTVGKMSSMEVSSGMQIVTVTGTNGSDGDIESFEMLVKLTAGSDALTLNDTLLTMDTKTTTQNVKYCGACIDCNSSSAAYAIEYIQNGSDHLNHFLTTGDIVKVFFNASSPITQSQAVRIRLIPKHGVIVPVDFITPDVISTQRIILYP